MPAPQFDEILSVLPPHLGDPTIREHVSPYPCTYLEVCTQFGTSPKRIEILQGLLALRSELFGLGISGYQWLSGSFVEDIETYENRGPNDIDVVTLTIGPGWEQLVGVLDTHPDLFNPDATKSRYFVDHYLLPLQTSGQEVADDVKYWYALFSHRRDNLWKGMLHVDLIDSANDDDARDFLRAPS